jgi:hypothetical protein
MERMLVESYPVGWAVDSRKAEPVAAFLIDIPGIAMQGRNLDEAITKLRALAPVALAALRRDNVVLPTPSREPTLTIGELAELRVRGPIGASKQVPEAELRIDLMPA